MKRIALFPGSFDPITIGHESIVRRAVGLFDEIIVSVGQNSTKQGFFSMETRLEWLRIVFEDLPSVKVTTYKGLTVDYCKEAGAGFILRGLRTAADFEFERSIGQMNKKMLPAVETVFLLSSPEYTPISSSIVRDIIRFGGDASEFVPSKLRDLINKQPYQL